MDYKKRRQKQPVKKMIRITVELKKEIVEKYENGMRVRDLTAMYHMPRSTISTIVKNKETIKSSNVAKGVKSVSKQRSKTLEEVEKLLLLWITGKQNSGESLSETIICEKAKLLHSDLMKDKAGTSQESEEFKASHGWFANFKKRTGIHTVGRHGEAGTLDKDIANKTVKQYSEFAENEHFVSKHDLNYDVVSMNCVNNVEELIQEQNEDPGTKLQDEERDKSQKKLIPFSSDSEEEQTEEPPSSLIKEILAKWMDVKNFSEKYHPNKVQTSHNSIVWEDQTMSYFMNILRTKEKQNSLDGVGMKSMTSTKQQKTEEDKTLECQVLLQEDFSSAQ